MRREHPLARGAVTTVASHAVETQGIDQGVRTGGVGVEAESVMTAADAPDRVQGTGGGDKMTGGGDEMTGGGGGAPAEVALIPVIAREEGSNTRVRTARP